MTNPIITERANQTSTPPKFLSRKVDLSPYKEWISLAAAHISNAVDTAIDELDRDHDFLTDDEHDAISSEGALPYFDDLRTLCKEQAIGRFVQMVLNEQQG